MPLRQSDSIYQKEGKVYCLADYLHLFCKTCTACGKAILNLCVTAIQHEHYHPDCFVCSVCKTRMKSYTLVGGFLRCKLHESSPIPLLSCTACRLPIDAKDNLVLFAGQKLHSACFRCDRCSAVLDRGSAKCRDEALYCLLCFHAQTQGSNAISGIRSQSSASLRSDELKNDHSNPSTLISSTLTQSSAENNASSSVSTNPSNSSANCTTGESKTNLIISSNGKAVRQCDIEWKRGELLGKGSFGKVFMAMNTKTGGLLAVKQIKLNTSEDHVAALQLQTEVTLMENLSHKHIVSLLGTQKVGENLNILMEFVAGKSMEVLLAQFGAFSEKVTRSYTKQLLSALAYCHDKGVMHRDIKGKNILIDSMGNCKLADFGSAKVFQNINAMDAPSMGYNYTALWTAPEVLTGDYNSKVDIWSLGCVMIEMGTAKPPWSEHNFEHPFRALYHIAQEDSVLQLPESFSEEAKAFMRKCLERNPEKRLSAQEALRERWINEE
jgi:hypothetical protein